MNYEGQFDALKCTGKDKFTVIQLDFKVEGEVLSVPSLPFVMLRLDKPHGKIDNSGWRFHVGDVSYMVPAEELARILRQYDKEKIDDKIARFYDIWQNKETLM